MSINREGSSGLEAVGFQDAVAVLGDAWPAVSCECHASLRAHVASFQPQLDHAGLQVVIGPVGCALPSSSAHPPPILLRLLRNRELESARQHRGGAFQHASSPRLLLLFASACLCSSVHLQRLAKHRRSRLLFAARCEFIDGDSRNRVQLLPNHIWCLRWKICVVKSASLRPTSGTAGLVARAARLVVLCAKSLSAAPRLALAGAGVGCAWCCANRLESSAPLGPSDEVASEPPVLLPLSE